MKLNTYLLSSLDTVFSDTVPGDDTLGHTSMLRNEAFTFQMAVRVSEDETDNRWSNVMELRVETESPLGDKIKIYFAENVPCTRVGYRTSDDWFERKTAGVYPDRLAVCENGNFTAPVGYTRSIYFNVNEECEDIPAGKYPIKIKLYKRNRPIRAAMETSELVLEKNVELEVIDALLQKQKIMATNWVHYDCMAYFSKTEPFSDEFFSVMKEYARLVANNGQNMILLPAFTPPLDTPVGEERMTVQLVGVTKENGKYSFDFTLVERFINICNELGIEYFEHSHLFSQWGAKHAPKIIVCEDGKDVKMFGWHTDSASEEYLEFIEAYITELKKFLFEKGYEKRFFFHISDEPDSCDLLSYGKVSSVVHKLLDTLPCGDALSEYELYEKGVVHIPIVATDNIGSFLGRAEHLWAYFTGMQSSDNLPNRLIGMPMVRCRILGTELYYHDIEGFLNWGFNAHHNKLSRKIIDPKISPEMDMDFVAGTSFLVYPTENGAEPSPRLLQFRDSMQDARAMLLLEELTDKETVKELIRKHIPDISFNVRVDAKQLEALRNEINSEIKKINGC